MIPHPIHRKVFEYAEFFDDYRTLARYIDFQQRKLEETQRFPLSSTELATQRELLSASAVMAIQTRNFAKFLNVLAREDDTILRPLSGTDAYDFHQGDYINGHCSAYCLEYVVWRKAGLGTAQALKKLRSPSIRHRLIETQRNLRQRYTGRMWPLVLSLPQTYAASSYITAFEQHVDLMKFGAWPSGRPAEGLPAMQFGALSLGGSMEVQCTFAMLQQIWPATVCIPQTRAPAKTETAPQAGAMPMQAASDIPAGRCELPAAGARAAQAYRTWSGDLEKHIRHFESRFGKQGYLFCFLANVRWGHFITLDLYGDMPGIFEPNYGFLRLPSAKAGDKFFHWLMAYLAYLYDAVRIDFMYVPAGEGQWAPASGLPDAKYLPPRHFRK